MWTNKHSPGFILYHKEERAHLITHIESTEGVLLKHSAEKPARARRHNTLARISPFAEHSLFMWSDLWRGGLGPMSISPVQRRRVHTELRSHKTIRGEVEWACGALLWSNREMPGCVSANIEGGHIPIHTRCILLLLSSEKLHSFTLDFHIAFFLCLLKPSWWKSFCGNIFSVTA